MIARCRVAGLSAIEFRQSGGQFIQTLGRVRSEATPEVTPEVRLVRTLVGEMTRKQLQRALGLRNDDSRKASQQPAEVSAHCRRGHKETNMIGKAGRASSA
jgi:hypothetical protein